MKKNLWLRVTFKIFVTENFSSSHRKLVVIFTEVEHSAEHKDVPAWKHKCVSDRLGEFDILDANIICWFVSFSSAGALVV